MSGGALEGIRVLDFSAALPGPAATLMLAEAGAEVWKVEPLTGEAARTDPAIFNILNQGKRSIAIDLKQDRDRLLPLVTKADVLVEQFRPGVMDRVGLGYEDVRAINPRIIYVSINGYGSEGPDRLRPGHDLNYVAESGLLSLNADANGEPVVPSPLAADIGASLSAVSNVALALYRREKTGEGARIEVSLFASVLPFLKEAIAHALAGEEPRPRYSASTGGLPRYGIYRTADGRHLAVGCAEEKFWTALCRVAGLPLDSGHEAIAARIAERNALDWIEAFSGEDAPVSLVQTVTEALATERMQRLIDPMRRSLPPLFGSAFLRSEPLASAPALGEANDLLA